MKSQSSKSRSTQAPRFFHRSRFALANEKGLTLIEIMVVIMIILGLAATLGKSVFDSLKNSKVSQTKLNFGEVSKALEMYNGSCSAYPTTEQGLQALMNDPGKEVCENWGPKPYAVKQVLKDGWNTPMVYESDGTTYTLMSLGGDKKVGGTGIDKDLTSSDDTK